MVATEKFSDYVNSLRNIFNTIKNKKAFKHGLPFLIFVVGGSFGLREWTQVRYQFSQVKGVSKEEAERMGLHREKKVTLENAYEEIQNLDTENWENKRGPRPWEEEGNKDKNDMTVHQIETLLIK